VHDLLLQHPDIVEIAAKQPVAGEAANRGAEAVVNVLQCVPLPRRSNIGGPIIRI
jgi:hypothetical protein